MLFLKLYILEIYQYLKKDITKSLDRPVVYFILSPNFIYVDECSVFKK